MNQNQNETLRHTRNDAARAARETSKSVVRQARRLSAILAKLADDLYEDPTARFNELGELQGNGVALDVTLAKLHEQNVRVDQLDYLVKRLSDQE